jgi:tRNA-dihydrouridine synthase A
MARAAAAGQRRGYDEININVGCPSGRVQAGEFGACLMKRPRKVAECFDAIANEVDLPVTVKTRLGVDDHDSYRFLRDFVGSVSEAGCRVFIVHARKALLTGLSPRHNREIPPLDHDRVYRLKRDFDHLQIVVNGGIHGVEDAARHLRHVDGVMIGRAAYHDSYALAAVDGSLNPGMEIPERAKILHAFLPYVSNQLRRGVPLQAMTRHTLGLFQGRPGARAYRRYLSENARNENAGVEVLETALRKIREAA